MGKYIKSNSVFTLRKRIQNLEGGAYILERDWTTLGERRKFGKGKVPIYNDGNFIFTRANIKLPSRRNKNSSESIELRYDDVKDAKSSVNNVELNTSSNDIRSFAYYGSCVDLVDKSISNIIMNFPGCISVSGKTLTYATYDGEGNINGYEQFTDKGKPLYVVENPFNIDILSQTVNLGLYDNQYRYMCETYDLYEMVEYEVEDSAVDGYKTLKRDKNGNLIEKSKSNLIGFSVEYNFDKCIKNDQWYNYQGQEPPIHIMFKSEDSEVELVGFRNDTDFIYLCNKSGVVIKPQDNIIENYFDNLKGFEKQLLTRDSDPLYKNVFITPVQVEENYKYVERGYTWPSVYNYCISIDSAGFEAFYNDLVQMATVYDEVWTNNLYGRMTHEAIKNFDWTYTKDYIDGEEEDNIAGGEQMQQVLHLIGRVFDEGKSYIDGIKNCNNVTNNAHNNIPDALISDTLELHGWDVTSVVPLMEFDEQNKGMVSFSSEAIDKLNSMGSAIEWFDTQNPEKLNTSNYDIEFMRRLLLSSKRIFQSKGTQESIDMIMGMFGFGRGLDNRNDDYKLTEEWYEVTPWSYNVKNEIIQGKLEETGDYITEENEFGKLPLKTVGKLEDKYIIPFYDRNIFYNDINDEFYFQSKGGWCHQKEKDDEFFKEYLETVSYLHVLSNTKDLLQVATVDVSENDIYYVVDLSDAPDIFGNDSATNYSHFFYVKDANGSTTEPATWGNINIEDDTPIAKKAKYLDNIVNTVFGNNPHVGFGNYDDGSTFVDFMKEPFKGYVDSGQLYYENEETKDDLEFEFETIEEETCFEQGVKISNQRKLFNEIDEIENGKIVKDNKYGVVDNKVRINSKVVTFENLVKEDGSKEYYKQYFRKCMLPYVLQVIPSTTILILKGF